MKPKRTASSHLRNNLVKLAARCGAVIPIGWIRRYPAAMTRLRLNFLAPVPVGHRIRAYRAERLQDGTWFPAGSPSLVYDIDTGITYASTSEAERIRRAPGEPVPAASDTRWLPRLEGKVVFCIVHASGGETGAVGTELEVDITSPQAYR